MSTDMQRRAADELDRLIAARDEAVKALGVVEEDLLDELVSAKSEYRKNPTDRTRARRDEAVAAIQRYRAVTREGREGVGVGGDAFASGNEG